jgi:hypothetical protein
LRIGGVFCRLAREIGMRSSLLLLALLVLAAPCHSDVPRIVLDAAALDANGMAISDGSHPVTFRVYDVAAGGEAVWSESQVVDVHSGRIHVELGRVNPLDLEWAADHFVSTQFDYGRENYQRTQLSRPGLRNPLGAASSDIAYLAADAPLYEPTSSSPPVGAVPGGNWGAEIGSYEGVIAYSNGADTGSWSSLEPYGTDGYQYQCVEYCRRFYRVHIGMSTAWYADGKDFYPNGPGWGLEQHPNGSGLPQPDDILCFTNSGAGHVAIVISATSSAISVIQQNCSTTTGFGTYTVSGGSILWAYGTCQGWLHKVGNHSDTTPPVISNVQATGVTGNSATISWATDDYCTSKVEYGLTTSYGFSTTEDTSHIQSHSMTLTGLSGSTLYHYRVKSTNETGYTTYSGDYTFTTSVGIPGQPTVAVVGSTSLSVTNNASDSATGYYAFRINDGSACSNKYVQSDGSVGASRVWQTKAAWGTKTVTGLSPGTNYTFDVAAAADSSGTSASLNRYGGTYVNSPTLNVTNKWSSGDTAATFNGSSQYVSLPTMGTDVNFSSGFTIECWARPTAWSLAAPVLQLKTTSANDSWSNHICFDMTSTGVMRAEVYDASGSLGSGNYYYASDTTNCVFTKNEWHHYAVVVKADKSLIWYKDGVAYTGSTRGSDSASVTAVTILPVSGVTRDVVQIARRYTTGPYWWTGSLDDVAVYNYALTGARIAAHSSAGDAASYNTEVVKDNPVGYWRLGESSGTAAADNKGGYSLAASATTSSCVIPSAPTDGSPYGSSATSITWAWTDVANETGYRVKDTGGVSKSGDLAANTVAWTEGSLSANTQYTRRIYAFSSCGESSGSTGQTKYTLQPNPTTPTYSDVGLTTLRVSTTGPTNLTLGSSGVQYKRSGVELAKVQALYRDESGLTPNTQYSYCCRAINGDNAGTAWSAESSVYTLAKAGESTDGTGSTGNVYCTTASKNTWYAGGKTFTFSNPAGFGTGGAWKASAFQYKWNKSATETWSTAGTAWSTGTISLTADSGDGDYYLHVRALNGDGTPNNTDVLNYGPFRSDTTAPSASTVADEGSYTPSLDTLKATWTASTDSGSGLARYEYAVGTSSSTQDIKGWTSNGTSTSATITGLTLTEGTTYYVQVRAADNAGNTSTGAAANGILAAPGATPISSAWTRPNDTQPLSLRNKIVTASIGNAFWLEETNRTGAIMVSSSASVAKGNTVSVAGVLKGDGASRYLLGDVVINSGGSTTIQPLGIAGKWLGGDKFNASTPGVTGGVGQYNIGLLVRCWGRVTYSFIDGSNNYFYLDDGSGLSSGGHNGIKVWCGTITPPSSGTTTVTGIVSAASIDGKIAPTILVRGPADILPM